MADFRVIIEWEQDAQGWDETWYWHGGSAGFGGLIADTTLLIGARLPITHGSASIARVSVKQIDVIPGRRQVVTADVKADKGMAPAALGLPKLWAADLLTNIDTTGRYKNRMYLRGLPTGCWAYSNTAPGSARFDGAAVPLIRTFEAQVSRRSGANPNGNIGEWAFPAASTEPVIANERNVINVELNQDYDPPRFQLTTDVDLPVVNGDLIYVHLVKGQGLEGINGRTTVLDTAGGASIVIDKTQQNTCPLLWKGKGVVGRVVFALRTIQTSSVSKGVIRSTGRPVVITKGRSRTKKNNFFR